MSPMPRLSAAAAAVFLLVLPAFAGDFEDGLKLMEARKYEEALPKLEKASEADPQDAAKALALSKALVGVGKFERGAKCLADAIEAHPDDIRLLVERGRAYLLLAGKLDAEKADPNMILAYVGDGDRWIKRALEKDPKNVDARYLKARVLQFQGADLPIVAKEYEAIVADAPKCFDAHWELGQIWMSEARKTTSRATPWGDKNKWVAAEKHFRDAFSADPASGLALLNATYAKAWQQAPATELVGDYAKCAELLPNDEAPLVKIWKLVKQAPAESRAAFERLAKNAALGGTPKSYVALLDAAGALAGGKGDAAAAAYVKAAEHYAGSGTDVYFVLYDAVIRQKGLDADQQESICEAAWKRWPGQSEIPNDFAFQRREASDFKRSLKWYLRASEASPNSPRVLNDTGLIYHYHMDDLEKAEPYYRRAIAAAEEQGIEWSNDNRNEGMGLRDALTNLAKILSAQKRTKELTELAEEHMPEGFPGRDHWLGAGRDAK